jgi:hypothetical protein
LLDDLGDRRGYSHLKEEALDRINWRNRFRKRLWTCRLTDYCFDASRHVPVIVLLVFILLVAALCPQTFVSLARLYRLV